MIPAAAKWTQHRSPACLVLLAAISLATLSPRPGTARTWHVPGDAPTIQAGINLAQPGDDVLIASGTYQEHDIVLRSGIWVHSDQGPFATEIDAAEEGAGVLCLDIQNVVIEGFTIKNGYIGGGNESGAGVRCTDSSLQVKNCHVRDCAAEGGGGYGGGIYAYRSSITIQGCRVSGCFSYGVGGGISSFETAMTVSECELRDNQASSGGGIHGIRCSEMVVTRCLLSGNGAFFGAGGGMWYAGEATGLLIEDCLINGNLEGEIGGGSGVYIGGGNGTILRCTVAGNRSWTEGPALGIAGGAHISLTSTIIAMNQGNGLECAAGSRLDVGCSDMFGNSGGNALCDDDLGGNFSADPLFCDAPNGDYTLDANSPCLPGNHPDGVDCGLIGARGQGCESTPTRPTTWGRIKAGFRDARESDARPPRSRALSPAR